MIVNFQCFLSYVLQNNYNHKQISSLVGCNWEVLMPLYQVTLMLFKIVVSRPLRLHAEVQSRSPLAEWGPLKFFAVKAAYWQNLAIPVFSELWRTGEECVAFLGITDKKKLGSQWSGESYGVLACFHPTPCPHCRGGLENQWPCYGSCE